MLILAETLIEMKEDYQADAPSPGGAGMLSFTGKGGEAAVPASGKISSSFQAGPGALD